MQERGREGGKEGNKEGNWKGAAVPVLSRAEF